MDTLRSDNPPAPGWTGLSLLMALVTAGATVVLTRAAWGDIVHIAIQDEESSHIWLVPILVGWLMLARWDRLLTYSPRPGLLGPVLMLAGWGLSYHGFYHQVQLAWHGGSLLMLLGGILAATGAGLIAAMPAAFVATLFLMPVPGLIRQEIAVPLQSLTAAIAQFSFDLFALPVHRSGNLLSYNGVDVTVAEACNGMRMVFTLLSVCYVFAFGTNLRAWVRAGVLAISPLIAVACNVIRVIPTVWVYGNHTTEVAQTFHNLSGWVMIFVSFFILMGLVRLLEWLQLPVRPVEVADPSASPVDVPPPPSRRRIVAAATLLVLAAVAAEAALRPRAADAEPYHRRVAAAIEHAPTAFGDWHSKPVEIPAAAVQMLRPNAILSRVYENAATGETISFFIVHCKDARDMAGHYPPVCYPGVGWTVAASIEEAWSAADPGASRPTLPGMVYELTRQVGIREQRLTVANLLVMPDGRFLRTMQGVADAAADYTFRFFGAAQVQLVFGGEIPPARRREIICEFLATYRPVLESVLSATPATPGNPANPATPETRLRFSAPVHPAPDPSNPVE